MAGLEWYRGKRVVITGGSSGIGRAAALQLAAAGASLGLVARGQGRLDETCEAARQVRADGLYEACPVDVSDRAAVRQALPALVERLGGIDVLINNAGVAHPGYIGDIADEVFDEMMAINYFGMVNVTRALLPSFVAQRQGAICNVSSLLGFMGIYGYTAYAASKFAMAGFSDCLRQDLMAHNVSVHVVFPPDTDTPQWHAENEVKPEATRAIAGNVKVMSADDVARAMLEGVARGRYHIVPGAMSKFTYFMFRHAPWLVRYVIDGDLKKHLRKQAQAPQAGHE